MDEDFAGRLTCTALLRLFEGTQGYKFVVECRHGRTQWKGVR